MHNGSRNPISYDVVRRNQRNAGVITALQFAKVSVYIRGLNQRFQCTETMQAGPR